MPSEEGCPSCGAPAPVRHCLDGSSGLRRVLFGNRVDLMMCLTCGALWCFASHGEDVRSPVGIRWTLDARDWQRVYDLDDGVSLSRWHRKQVRGFSRGVQPPCGRRVCRFSQRKILPHHRA